MWPFADPPAPVPPPEASLPSLSTVCATQPCLELPGGFTLLQPSSTLLVLILGLEFFVAGVAVGVVRSAGHGARRWWGAAFITWGIACWLAAVSHQAFTWHVRCAGPRMLAVLRGKEPMDYICLTELQDPFHLSYLWLQNFALNLFVVARCYRAVRRMVPLGILYAFCNGVALAVGMYYDEHYREFEGVLLFSFPTWLFLFIVNRTCIGDWTSTASWLLLGMSFGLFKLVQALPFKTWYTTYGIWFTDNDALHVGNLLFLPVAYLSASRVVDAPPGTTFEALPREKSE